MNPILKFKNWYAAQLQCANVNIPSACCLSTLGLDDYPNSRFVSLKDIREDHFVICGPLSSRKGKEINKNPKVSIVFWWEDTQKQVRIQGIAHLIDGTLSDLYFEDRNVDSKIISSISKQGEVLEDDAKFNALFETKKAALGSKVIKRPSHWGGFAIEPVRIEFMHFKSSRFHEREYYEKSGIGWKMTKLQP